MSKKGTSKKILHGLNEFVKATEFVLNERNKSFIRKTDFGFQEISFIGESPSRGQAETGLPLYEVVIILAIRFDSVEEKLGPLKLVIGKANQKKTTTIFRPVHGSYPFKRFRDKPVKIGYKHTERDITKAVDRMKKMILSDGHEWFKKYSDLTIVESELNSSPFWRETNLLNNRETRIYRGVCAAGVCKGKSYAEEIARNYLNAMHMIKRMPTESKNRIEEKTAKVLQQF